MGGSRASAGWRKAAATGGGTARAKGGTFQSRGQAGSTFTFTTGRYGSDPFAAAKGKAADSQNQDAQSSSSTEAGETETFDEMKPWTWRVVH